MAALAGSTLLETRTFEVGRRAELVDWASGAAAIAIDSPDRWSSGPHRDDDSLAPKFRTARCAEIGLGRQFGVWVSWATPTRPLVGSWMHVGIDLFAALRDNGHEPLEVYPFAAFSALAGGRSLPKKQTRAGRRERASLLSVSDGLSHDSLDACAAALVARDHHDSRAAPATCGHDGTAIWLPAGVTEAATSLGRR
ncbi:MAG: DUF429 domain-containing protein [Actinomycetota bacterium]|nr:DUF429 domain-containing protein [Actinomycetota bacterium]